MAWTDSETSGVVATFCLPNTVFVANYSNQVLVITYPRLRSEFKDQLRPNGSTYLRYHCTSGQSARHAIQFGKGRLATGWSRTDNKLGVYMSDSAAGALFYAHGDSANIATLLLLEGSYEGTNVGKTKSSIKTNRCWTQADAHSIVAAFVFRHSEKKQGPVIGTIHPAGMADHKDQVARWPQWYTEYCKEALGVDQDWKFLGLNKLALAPAVVELAPITIFDPEKATFLRARTGKLIHAGKDELPGSVFSALCSLSLIRPVVVQGYEAAKRTGCPLCSCCFSRMPSSAQKQAKTILPLQPV